MAGIAIAGTLAADVIKMISDYPKKGMLADIYEVSYLSLIHILPIIGMGGIASAEDALEFILAGATAVAVGTANFRNPLTTIEVIDGIEDYMKRHHVENLTELIGAVH